MDNNKKLRIKTANRSFYEAFHISAEETENQFIYDLGKRQWAESDGDNDSEGDE